MTKVPKSSKPCRKQSRGQERNHMRNILGVLVLFLLTGCINITTKLAPDNPAVKAMREGSACSWIVFGFGYGTNTVEGAMANAEPFRITKIRSVALGDYGILGIGQRCIEVSGEGDK
jgi:hypothetical protein